MENIISQLHQFSEEESIVLAKLSAQLGYLSEAKALFLRTKEILESKNDSIFIATAEGKTVGFIHAFRTARIETPIFVEIATLVVDQNHRNQHIGENLISAATKWANELGISKIVVRCNVIRKETHRFYERLGFIEKKEQKIFECQR